MNSQKPSEDDAQNSRNQSLFDELMRLNQKDVMDSQNREIDTKKLLQFFSQESPHPNRRQSQDNQNIENLNDENVRILWSFYFWIGLTILILSSI